MTLANKRNPDGTDEYINGDLGVVAGIHCDENGIGSVLVEFDDGRTAVIEAVKWTTYKYELERDRNTGKELIKQIEVNIDYILMLVAKYHESNCQDKEILANITKAVNASIQLRSKKELIEGFVAKINARHCVLSCPSTM